MGKLVLVVASLTFVLTACSGDGSETSSTGTPWAQPPSATSGQQDPARAATLDDAGADDGVEAVQSLFTAPPLLPQGVDEPDPMDVDVELETGSSTSVTVIAETGGVLETTAEDGTRYVLSIPGNALLFDTEITMTPVGAAAGFSSPGTTLAGVQFEPDGLRLYDWAELEVFPTGGADQAALAYGYHGDGQELHGQPLAVDPDRVVVDVLHFSGELIYLGDGIYASPEVPAVQPTTPTDWESQIKQAMQELLAKERQAQLLGQEGDPQLWEKVQQLMDLYYDKVVAGILERMVRDCEFAQANAHTPLSWSRQGQLLGLNDQDPRHLKVMQALIESIENCWDEAMKHCIDVESPAAIQKVLGIARQGQLLGGSEEKFDASVVLAPDSEPAKICGDAFGTIVWQRIEHSEPQPSWNAVSDDDEVIVAEINLESDGDGGFTDKGSTFSWNGHSHSSSHAGTCNSHKNHSIWTGAGPLTDPQSYNRMVDLGIDEDGAYLTVWVDGVMKSRTTRTDEDADGDCHTTTSEGGQGPEEWPQVMFCPDAGSQSVPGAVDEDATSIDFTCQGTEEGPVNDGHYERRVTVAGSLTLR